MATGIIHKGHYTARPGVYSELHADAAGAIGPFPRGTVAVIGEMRKAQSQIVHVFGSSGALQKDLDECACKKAGVLAFDPTTDRRIPGGGANNVLAVGVNPSVAASITLPNADGDCITFTSEIYGIPGNRMNVEVANGTTQGKKVTLHYDGNDYVYDDLGGDAVLKLMYSNAGDADTMIVEIDPTTDITIDYSTDQAGDAVYTPTEMVFGGTIDFDCDEQQWEKVGALLNEIATDYEAHRTNGGGAWHTAPDGVNAIGAVFPPTSQAECVLLVNDIYTQYEAHRILVGGGPCHGQADGTNVANPALFPCVTLDDVVAGANELKTVFNLHRTEDLGMPLVHAIDDTVNVVTGADAVKTVDVVITGTYEGSPQSETLTLTDPGVATETSTKQYDGITNIDMTDVMASTTVTISGRAMTVVFADNPYIQNAIDYILSRGSTQGFSASTDIGNAGVYACTDLDTVAAPGTDIKGVAYTDFYADLAEIVAGINQKSDLISAAVAAPGTGAPNNTGAPVYLTGGLNGVAGAGDWSTCLALLDDLNITCLVILSDDAAIHALANTYVLNREDVNELYLALGAATTDNKAAIKARVPLLNNRFAVLAWQEVQVYYGGAATWVEPMYLAAMFAGMFAGRPVGRPLTWKIPSVIDFRQDSSISLPDDATEMIEAGTMFLTRDADLDMIKNERETPTYLAEEIPEFTAWSASESCTESLRDMRAVMKAYIGVETFTGVEEELKAVGASRLRRQKDPNDLAYIKDWRSIQVTDLGDTYRVDYEAAALEGITFIPIHGFFNRSNVSA